MNVKKMMLYTAPVALAGLLYLGGTTGVGEVLAKVITTMTEIPTKVPVGKTKFSNATCSSFVTSDCEYVWFDEGDETGRGYVYIYDKYLLVTLTETETEVPDDPVISSKVTPSETPEEAKVTPSEEAERRQREAEQQRQEAAVAMQKAAEQKTVDFINEIKKQVQEIKDGLTAVSTANGSSVAVITTDYFTCFTKEMMELLAANPDVSYEIHYRYQGKRYVLVIPAGADLGSLQDSNGYYGFRYLDSIFGGYEEVK